jgi:putative cardiolipin synthase
VFLDSPELAEWTSDRVEEVLPKVAYLLRLDERGKIEWVWLEDGEQVVYTSEPEAGLAQRLAVNFYSLLPIEGHL